MAYPYDWIEAFWGESLSPELNARIEAAPVEHIAAFAQANDHINFDDPRYFVPPLEPLPELPRGQLRPVVVQSALLERYFSDGKKLMAELTTAMLLYAHQAVLPDVSDLLTAESGEARRFAADWLMRMKPLHDAGLIHLRHIDTAKLHPSSWRLAIRDRQVLLKSDAPTIRTLMDQIDRSEPNSAAKGDAREGLAMAIAHDVTFFDTLMQGHEGRAHRLLRSDLERVALLELGRSASVDKRLSLLTTLGTVGLPRLDADLSSVVALRCNDELFARWRAALGKALIEVDSIDLSSERRLEEGRGVIYGEMEEARATIVEGSRKSRALTALMSGVGEFSISSASACLPMLLATNTTAAAAVAGAIGAGIAAAAIDLVQLMSAEPTSSVVDHVVLSFFDEN